MILLALAGTAWAAIQIQNYWNAPASQLSATIETHPLFVPQHAIGNNCFPGLSFSDAKASSLTTIVATWANELWRRAQMKKLRQSGIPKLLGAPGPHHHE
jgi:hypothetical protein